MSVKNLKNEFETVVPENIRTALCMCSEAAEKQSLKIFLIGGAVRDLIIKNNHFDTDITVEGNAVEFAYFLEKTYPGICKIKEIHEKFMTAKVAVIIDNEEINLDVASTRKEIYPHPACLPEVEEIGCELFEDVKRRDFSINSMALSLNKADFCDLTDYLNGYADIKNKKIRILHPESFTDDPTRIIRALKFRVRFGFELDEETEKLQNKTLESGMFDNLCGERIKSEIKQTFNLNKTECREIFINENIYRLLDKDIKIPENISGICESTVCEYSDFINPDFIWLIYLGVMLCDFSKEKIAQISQKSHLSNPETEILIGAEMLLKKAEFIKKACSDFEIYEFFEGFSTESILIFLIKFPEFKEKINLYLKELRNTKIVTTGQDLLDAGLKPGPVFKEILRALLKAKLNGEFSSAEDEKEFLKSLILRHKKPAF